MSDTQTKSGDLRKLNDFLAKWVAPDDYTRAAKENLQHALQLLPMAKVLDEVPGESVLQKCENAGVSRSTWYVWLRCEVRPNKEQAARLAELTKIPAEKFAGRC